MSDRTRTLLVLAAVVPAAALAILFRPAGKVPPVLAAAKNPAALLIRFGTDGAAGVDWSGAVSPAPARLSGWQFDSADSTRTGAWKCATLRQTYWDTPYERRMGPTASRDKTTAKGVVAEYDAPPAGPVRIETSQGAFSFTADASLWFAPRAFLDGRVEVRMAPAGAVLSSGDGVPDYPSLIAAPDGTLWLAYVDWTKGGDHVVVRRGSGGAWSEPETLTSAPGDLFRTAVAADRSGKVWVVWSAQVSGNFDLYGRAWDGRRWSAPERLTSAPGADIYHVMIAGRDGKVYLAYQSSRAGNFDIYMRTWDGTGWSREAQVSSDPANDWEPALAAAADGRVTVLWDTYAGGNYDVVGRTLSEGRLGAAVPIAESGAFESRASAAYDAQGRLWVAWDEGDFNWGKDYGNLIPESGRGLLVRRAVRVAVMAGGRLHETTSPLIDSVPADFRQAFQKPRLVLDGAGAPWVLYRYRVNLPRAKGEETYRGTWRLGASAWRGGRWTPALEFPGSHGRIDAPLAAVASAGRIEVAWVSDGRPWPLGFPERQTVRHASLPASGGAAPASGELAAFRPPSENLPASHPNEAADIARLRTYRTNVEGTPHRIVRGDIHRHTDLSWDGNRDGSLDDAYRYAMDAAGFEFLGVCDHQAGQSIPYHWWMIQKAVDLFTIPGRFAPLYSYERSLPWPNGHRNVLFARRGNPVLEISPGEQKGTEGAGKLYRYLRELKGLVTSHTSATGAGTDWRDSDQDLEPVVEIYQGYRHNFEEPDGPRHPGEGEAKRFAAGFVWSAWAKGIRMGVQSSSDHVSTHISYAGLFVRSIDRQAVFEALAARRAFAATDNLMVETRLGGQFMGAVFNASRPLPFRVHASGTGPLAAIEVIRNNRIVYTAPGDGREATFTYSDRDISPGEWYYYARVRQRDGQLAWSSPIWVRR